MDDCSQRDPIVVREFFCESRPGPRPSPHSLLRCRNKGVDARDEPGHEGGKTRRSPQDAR
jgi:hypothetical protein